MNNYPVMRLRDAGVTLYDCEHKTPKPAKSGYPYIAIPNIQDGRLDLSDVRLITKEDFDYWTRKIKPQKGDIIVTRRGRVGDTAVVPEGLDCAIGQNLVILRSEGDEVDQNFLRWALRGPFYEEQIEKFLNVGAIFYSLNCADIPNFELPIPPIHDQRAIAGILGALDDKIELNRRMNRTLESMARVVFRQWFVDNDDVGDWEVGQIKDLGEVITGKTPPTNDRENYDGETPFITIPDMHGKMFVIETGKTLSEKGVQTQRNKTLPPFSICISCIATPGLVSMTTEPSQTNQQINSLIPNDKKSAFYSFFALRELGDEIRARGGGGSVLLNLNKGQFEAMPISMPSIDLMHKFHEFAEPLLLRLFANEKESRTLASLRDSLLPKLMRGEVRVRVK